MENKILNVTIIAGNVHQLRLAANLTQTELAKLIHVSTNSINAWERGHTYPSLINVLAIYNYLILLRYGENVMEKNKMLIPEKSQSPYQKYYTNI